MTPAPAPSTGERERVFYDVPAGTRPTVCRGESCGKTIYFVPNARGGKSPIDCDVEGGRRPSDSNDPTQVDAFAGEASVYDGRGVSHFTTCADVEQFTRGAR